MKHEILKKTLLYRFIQFGIGTFITTLFLFNNPLLSLKITTVSEIASVGIYYAYEYLWRKYMEYRILKEGSQILLLPDSTVRIAYNVIEVLDDNKFIIEVV